MSHEFQVGDLVQMVPHSILKTFLNGMYDNEDGHHFAGAMHDDELRIFTISGIDNNRIFLDGYCYYCNYKWIHLIKKRKHYENNNSI